MAKSRWKECRLYHWDSRRGDVWDVGFAFDAATVRMLVIDLSEDEGDKPDYFIGDYPWTGINPAVPGIDEALTVLVVMREVFGIFRSCVGGHRRGKRCCIESRGHATGCHCGSDDLYW